MFDAPSLFDKGSLIPQSNPVEYHKIQKVHDHHIAVSLNKGENVTVVGYGKMFVVHGTAETFGASVEASNSPVKIYSCDWSGLISVCPSLTRNAKSTNTGDLQVANLSTLDLNVQQTVRRMYKLNRENCAALLVFQAINDAPLLISSKLCVQWYGRQRLVGGG